MITNIEIVKYRPEYRKVWNDFVESSKNGTFLFNRAYMDYHSNRFEDCSYLIYNKNKLFCLLPANVRDDIVYSHQGLTYGGLIMNDNCKSEGILQVFESLLNEFRDKGIKKLVYKPVPYIYSNIPSQEDLYALFRNNASLTGRNISSTVYLPDRLSFATLRKRMIKRAKENDMIIRSSDDLPSFWFLLENNLSEKYGVKPVHSLEEISLLKSRFPDNIGLYAAYRHEKMLAGVVCYIFKNIVHCQYISANKEGKESGALDLLFDYLINIEFKEKSYFDFGISNEEGGRYLNEGLISQKEGFGGRGVCYDTYEIDLSN